jgi:hypothetical protein
VAELSLTFGAVVGVVLSAGFVWYEIGRYAAPQVSASRFNELKEMYAYTAGLFIGIPLAVALLFLLSSLPLGEIGGVAIYLAALVGGAEFIEWLMLRSIYFGSDGSGPFYAVGFRAGVGGILVLAIVAQALTSPALSVESLAVALAQSVAVLALQISGGVLSLPPVVKSRSARGGPGAGATFSAVGFFLLALGPAFGSEGGFGAAVLVAAIAVWMYARIGRATLDRVRPERPLSADDEDEELSKAPASPFRRTDQ